MVAPNREVPEAVTLFELRHIESGRRGDVGVGLSKGLIVAYKMMDLMDVLPLPDRPMSSTYYIIQMRRWSHLYLND